MGTPLSLDRLQCSSADGAGILLLKQPGQNLAGPPREDPIGFGGGDVNLYRYVGNGPTIYVDPSGLEGRIADGGIQGPHGFVPRFVPFDPPSWQEPYNNNPSAQEDFDNLLERVWKA